MRSTSAKYGNKKKVIDGVKFDSQLEAYCYNMLKILNVDFEFQKTIILIEKFRFEGKAIRETTAIVDFVIKNNNETIYLDTKGFATEVSKIKYKMLKFKLKDQENNRVVWLHSKKEVTDFINNLKTNQNVNNQQSSITW